MKASLTLILTALLATSAFGEECRLTVEVETQRIDATFFQNLRHPDYFSPRVYEARNWEACYRRGLKFSKANRIGDQTRIHLASPSYGRVSTLGRPYVSWKFRSGFLSTVRGALTEYSAETPRAGDVRRTDSGDTFLAEGKF